MAEPSELEVGARLRDLREQRKLSLRALAGICGLSPNAISLIERGETSPSVSTLNRLAAALETSILDFFQEETKQTVILIKRAMGLRSQHNGTHLECLGVGLFNQKLEPFRMTIDPGAGNANHPISHSGEEFIYCLEGSVEYSVNNHAFKLEPGDSLLFDATQPHAYHNPYPQSASILLIYQSSHERQNVGRLHLEG